GHDVPYRSIARWYNRVHQRAGEGHYVHDQNPHGCIFELRSPRMRAFFKTLIVALALAGAACKMQLRPAKTPPAPQAATAKAEPQPSPPSEPLSIPQTQVRLPRPQPIDPEALATPPIILPEPPTPRQTSRAAKSQSPSSSPLPIKPEQPEPIEPPPATEALRPRVEPVLPADERRQLIEDVSSRLKQVDQMLGRLNSRRLSEAEKNSVARIHSFEALSRQALERGEAQQASALADRALLLAQELDRAR